MHRLRSCLNQIGFLNYHGPLSKNNMPVSTFLILLVASLGFKSPSPAAAPPSIQASPVVLPLSRGLFSRYIKALGGRVAIWDLKSFTAHATLQMTGSDTKGELDLAFRNANLMRIRVDLGELGISEVGSNGTIAWELITTDKGDESEELIDLKDARERRRTLNWFELAIQINADTKSMQTIGPAEFEGFSCWEVQKINRSGLEERIFIDRDSYLLRGIRMMEHSETGDYEVVMSFRNWKPVAPLVLFHEIVISSQDLELIIEFDSISLDKASPHLFQPPQSVIELLEDSEKSESNSGDAPSSPTDNP